MSDVLRVFELADEYADGQRQCTHGAAVLFFPESSIRTRVTFEMACTRLGLQPILFPPETLAKKEDPRDVMGYLANWVDVVIARFPSIDRLREFAATQTLPVINAMTDVNHPCGHRVRGRMLAPRRTVRSMDTIDWLLDTDPALRWQVERDLVGAPEAEWQATRALTATEGMGAALLAEQGDDGLWAGGAYFPNDFDFENAGEGQPWTATTWSLTTLREWGVDGAALKPGTADLIDANARWEYDDLPYWGGEVDVCINAMTLANGSWLGRDMSGLARWFVEHQMAEGGWNCEWIAEPHHPEPSTRASVHSTINALLGIDDHQARVGHEDDLDAAVERAGEYLLQRRLLHRLSDGEPIGDFTTRNAYPFRHVYSALRALDHFRRIDHRDERLAEAVDVVRAQADADGRWCKDYHLPGDMWFPIDVEPGEQSPWLTFHALRVLRWWDEGA